MLLELYNFTKIQLYKVYWRRETIREEIRVQGRNVSDVGQCFGMEYRVESIYELNFKVCRQTSQFQSEVERTR